MSIPRCPQAFALAILLGIIALSISVIAGPSVLVAIIRTHPIGHTFVILVQFAVLMGLCHLNARLTNWFIFAMFAAASILTYSLSAFVIAKADKLRPLVKKSMDCVHKAKTPEERKQCQARALEHLRAALQLSAGDYVRPSA
jgi:hypothetical protein